MTETSDVILSIVGFLVSFYGSAIQDLSVTILGILVIFLTITLKFQSQDEDIKFLKGNMHLYYELMKLREDIKKLQHEKHK